MNGKIYRHILILTTMCFIAAGFAFGAEKISQSFELRYFSDDPGANGETDFKGRTSVFDTKERVDFLSKYAEYGSRFFGDIGLNRKVVSESEVEGFLQKLKPQPLPKVRKRILLKNWKKLGYKDGQREDELERIEQWNSIKGVRAESGRLVLLKKNVIFEKAISPQSWRFFLQFKAMVPEMNSTMTIIMGDDNADVLMFGFDKDGKIFYCTETETVSTVTYKAEKWYEFKVEVDLSNKRYNFYVDGKLQADFVKVCSEIEQIGSFVVKGDKGTALDDIWGVGYAPTEDVSYPYTITTFIDEDFEAKPEIEGWYKAEYDDGQWGRDELPIVHGGERFAGESLYLRNKVEVGNFTRAVLNAETIDPAGEVWINGEVAAVINDRHPAEIDVTKYLRKNQANLIAVRVKPFTVEIPMHHTPTDHNIGWFAGRIRLDLIEETYIDDVFVYANDVTDPAPVQSRITIRNDTSRPFEGSVVIKFYPWYPSESSEPAATERIAVKARAWSDKVLENVIDVPQPKLWTFDNPNLYRVEVTLEDESGKAVDDEVLTTGIRTVSQDGGIFRINGKHEMLNGAQIMGFRMPLDKIAMWNRCAPAQWLAKELLMIQKMNGNMMRVHVHAWENPARSINDPRLAEMGDQLGMMFIWATTAWIRANEAWGVDFEGYPKYMRQVYNHPSIVMWEASNHPNVFKKGDASESNDYVEKIYNTIYPVDPSRLISTTSFIGHMHYGNDAGTVDYKGNAMVPCREWTAPMVTRGSQDAITGYGSDWSKLRKWPSDFTRDFLESRERAFFNFEHEESIGQPNWELAKGKPWYQLQSYEWKYDDGSIGQKLTVEQWRQSQAWQAFSAYESMKKQRILDYDGFSWCCLHGGANTGTYKKPLIDNLDHGKLAYYANKMVFQRVLGGSDNVDVVYGPDDFIKPVILNLGPMRKVDLAVNIFDMENRIVDSKVYQDVELSGGRTVTSVEGFKPTVPLKGYFAIEYEIFDKKLQED